MAVAVAYLAALHTLFVFAWCARSFAENRGRPERGLATFAAWLGMVCSGGLLALVAIALLVGRATPS